MLNGYVEVRIFNNDIEAEIAKGLLAENGIEALINKDDVGGMFPNLQMTQGVHLLVLPRDKEKSEMLLGPLLDSGDVLDENQQAELMWHCPNCHTVLEPQFTECWKCGTSRKG